MKSTNNRYLGCFDFPRTSNEAGVEIHYISFGDLALNTTENTALLTAAIADARIPLLGPVDGLPPRDGLAPEGFGSPTF